ncbi:hypothetical protein HDU96_003151 [Phlyctochytrium bullatum]|nr:hypothetical protein HDU96_003151 [Phlyctochytrium bullatum]
MPPAEEMMPPTASELRATPVPPPSPPLPGRRGLGAPWPTSVGADMEAQLDMSLEDGHHHAAGGEYVASYLRRPSQSQTPPPPAYHDTDMWNPSDSKQPSQRASASTFLNPTGPPLPVLPGSPSIHSGSRSAPSTVSSAHDASHIYGLPIQGYTTNAQQAPPPTLGARLDMLLDHMHEVSAGAVTLASSRLAMWTPAGMVTGLREARRQMPNDMSFTGPMAPLWVPLFVVFIEFPLAMATFAFVLGTAVASSVSLLFVPFIGAPLYTVFAMSWRVLAKLDLMLYRDALELTTADPYARQRIFPLVPHPPIPAAILDPTDPAYAAQAPRPTLWARMRAIMLDRSTTFSILLFCAVKPALSLVSFLYVIVVVLPLTVTGFMFILPARRVAAGPPLTMMTAYASCLMRIGDPLPSATFAEEGDVGAADAVVVEVRPLDVLAAEEGAVPVSRATSVASRSEKRVEVESSLGDYQEDDEEPLTTGSVERRPLLAGGGSAVAAAVAAAGGRRVEVAEEDEYSHGSAL